MPALLRQLLVSFALLHAAGGVLAQDATPVPGASPRAWTLPSPSGNTNLPGSDPRQCGTSSHDALCAVGRWSRFARMELTLKTGAFAGRYTMERPANGEVLTTFSEESPSGRRGGEVLIVNDVSYAYRTRDKSMPAEADVLDYMLAAPNMAMQLVSVLLDQAVLEAPASVTGARTLAAESATQYIRTETPNLATAYGPPWRVTGSVRPAGKGAIAFTLEFHYRPVDKRGTLVRSRTDRIELSGVIGFDDRKPSMPDSFDLVGWKTMRSGQPGPPAETLEEARRNLAP